MNKFVLPAAAIAFVSASTLAFAATDTGAIKTIDATKPSITLADGKLYLLAKTFKVADLKVGEKVTVTYDVKGSDMVATAVVAAK
jgi:hypothetical protein